MPMNWNLSQISREIISRGACPLYESEQSGVCQNAACSSEYFLLQVDYALEGSTF